MNWAYVNSWWFGVAPSLRLRSASDKSGLVDHESGACNLDVPVEELVFGVELIIRDSGVVSHRSEVAR